MNNGRANSVSVPIVHSGVRDRSTSSLRYRADLMFGAFIGLAVTAALWLRWSGLDSQSLWLDEGITFWISRFSPEGIWHILQLDTSNPLYYILLHYWTGWFGTSEFSIRALSATFAALSIPIFYQITRKVVADRAAIALAMMLYAVSFYQVWYAQEARCYALLVLLSLASVYLLMLCLEKGSLLRLSGLAFCITASLYTHNIAIFYLPGIVVMWLAYPAEMPLRKRLRDAVVVFSLITLLYLPWVSTLRGQLHRVHAGLWVWVTQPKIRDLLESLCVLSGTDTHTLQAIFRHQFHSSRFFGFWTWAPAILVVFVLCILGGICTGRFADRRKVAALLAYSLIPVFLVFIDSRISTSIYVNRAFLGCCALLPIVFCAPIAFQSGNRRRAFQMLGLLVLLGSAVSAIGYLRRERKEDWRGATEYLVKLPEKRRLLVIVPDIAQGLVQYYASGLPGPYRAPEMSGLLTSFTPPDLTLEDRILHLQDDPNVDALALLSGAMASGKYKEIDMVVQPGTSPFLIEPAEQYLAAHCGTVDVVEFHWLEVRRCSVQSARSSDGQM